MCALDQILLNPSPRRGLQALQTWIDVTLFCRRHESSGDEPILPRHHPRFLLLERFVVLCHIFGPAFELRVDRLKCLVDALTADILVVHCCVGVLFDSRALQEGLKDFFVQFVVPSEHRHFEVVIARLSEVGVSLALRAYAIDGLFEVLGASVRALKLAQPRQCHVSVRG